MPDIVSRPTHARASYGIRTARRFRRRFHDDGAGGDAGPLGSLSAFGNANDRPDSRFPAVVGDVAALLPQTAIRAVPARPAREDQRAHLSTRRGRFSNLPHDRHGKSSPRLNGSQTEETRERKKTKRRTKFCFIAFTLEYCI